MFITCIPHGDPRTDRYLLRGCLVTIIVAVAAGGCLITTIVWRFLP